MTAPSTTKIVSVTVCWERIYCRDPPMYDCWVDYEDGHRVHKILDKMQLRRQEYVPYLSDLSLVHLGIRPRPPVVDDNGEPLWYAHPSSIPVRADGIYQRQNDYF